MVSVPDSATILLVDDEDAVQKLLTYPLERDGYRVVPARDGEEALDQFARERVDLVVLDIMLPSSTASRSAASAREQPGADHHAHGARRRAGQGVGLELGADDYITKPFSIREFRSRVRALLRRAAVTPRPTPTARRFRRDGLVVDLGRRTVELVGEPIQLTYVEFEILRTMMSRPGRVFSRHMLLEQLWG